MSKYFVRRSEAHSLQPFPGVHLFTTSCEKMMVSLVELEPGAIVERHSHPHEQVGLLIEGELHFEIGDERQTMYPGDMWRIPGGVEHRAVAGAMPTKAVDVFHPIREDYSPSTEGSN